MLRAQAVLPAFIASLLPPLLSRLLDPPMALARRLAAWLGAAAAASPLVGIVAAALLSVGVVVAGLAAAAALGLLWRRPAFSYLMQAQPEHAAETGEEEEPEEYILGM